MSLDDLLSAAEAILNDSLKKSDDFSDVKLKQTNNENEDEVFLGKISNYKPEQKPQKSKGDVEKDDPKKKSFVHSGDTDSSDDEQNRDYENAKYNDFGKQIKRMLAPDDPSSGEARSFNGNKLTTWKTPNNPHELGVKAEKPTGIVGDVYTDPVFGIRIVKPLISSTVLQERMIGRDAVHMSKLKWYISKLTPEKNWVVAGVIIRKTIGKTSAKGNQYSIWTLSDLHGDLKTVLLFLFRSANKELWKLSQGSVVGILNPNVLESRGNGKEEATLSVENAQKVMILGQSKDFGQCKSTTKSGQKCTAFVNTSKCEFCLYHVKQEYQKCSGRSDLQSSFTGRGLTALRNKVLGKNEVFYAGKSYSAIPAKKSKKLESQDQKRLAALSGKTVNNGITTSMSLKPNTGAQSVKNQSATRLDISYSQRAKDLELLRKLGKPSLSSDQKEAEPKSIEASRSVTLEESKNTALSVIAKLRLKNQESKENTVAPTPKLSGFSGGMIDLSAPIPKWKVDRAKLNAIKYIQKNGPLKKEDPMAVRTTGKKRPILDDGEAIEEVEAKKAKTDFTSERFKKLMAATSKHQDLLEQLDNEEQEKYFNKLEMKERLEEKMMSTYRIECKAVRCLSCKYTSFSAAEKCKAEKHPLKVFDTFKRFFKCGDCGNRTCVLEVVPVNACQKCGSGRWERTTMMKEKVVNSNSLSIRGGEQKFLNSNVSDSNLNLLVPDD